MESEIDRPTYGMKRRIKKLWVRYIASVSLTLNALLVASVGIVLLHDFVFAGRLELFRGSAQIWDLAYRLSLALIGSYIFYYVVVHAKRQQDKENLLPFLRRQTRFVFGDAKSLASVLKGESGHDFVGDYPNLEDARIVCAKVRPNDKAPVIIGATMTKANWLQYLLHARSRTEKALPRIYATAPFLDSDYLKLLTNIENCHYFTMLDHIAGGIPVGNDSLSFLAQDLHGYFEHAKALEKYANEKLV